MNDYFNPSETPADFAWKRAEQLRSEFAAVAAGFNKLPPLAELKQGRSSYIVNSGTGNAYEINVTPAIPDYVIGQRFGVLASGINTNSATLNVNGLGARVIARVDGVAVTAGDLGTIFEVVYDGARFRLTIPALNSTALQRSENLGDLFSPATARANLGLLRLATLGQVNLASADVGGILPVVRGGTGGTNAAGIRTAAGLTKFATAASIALDVDTSGILPVAKGGTGATSAAGIRSAAGLGIFATAAAVRLNADTTETLAISRGGTSATNAADARSNLELGAFATKNSASLSTSETIGTLPVSKGGTGATFASTARANLGLGGLATQNTVSLANEVRDTLFVSRGGTGATTVVGARSSLGLGTLSTLDALELNSLQAAGVLPVSKGGTGSTELVDFRNKLSLGTAALADSATFLSSGPPGSIRTMAFLKGKAGFTATVGPGATKAGSQLAYAGSPDDASYTVSPPGTWECHGASVGGAATLWKRIA